MDHTYIAVNVGLLALLPLSLQTTIIEFVKIANGAAPYAVLRIIATYALEDFICMKDGAI
jgi:hypothetical protein